MLGLHDFDNHNWTHTTIPFNLQEIGIQFIENNHFIHHIHQTGNQNITKPNSSSQRKPKLSTLFIIILQKIYFPSFNNDYTRYCWTRKYFLIKCIK